jgi:hypothetical protein
VLEYVRADDRGAGDVGGRQRQSRRLRVRLADADDLEFVREGRQRRRVGNAEVDDPRAAIAAGEVSDERVDGGLPRGLELGAERRPLRRADDPLPIGGGQTEIALADGRAPPFSPPDYGASPPMRPAAP